MLLLSLLLSLTAHADAPSPSEALTLFQHSPAVRSELRALEDQGYRLDGDAGASLFSLGYGDEGYCSAYLASQPLAKGAGFAKSVRLVAARVYLCWPNQRVELVEPGSLREALRKPKAL